MEVGVIICLMFIVLSVILFIGTMKTCVTIYTHLSRIPVYSDSHSTEIRRQRIGEIRQAAVYTIATDPRRGNDSTSNFPDFFWDVSPPRSNEPAKDDKDLPSYEEVMRIEMARQVVDSTIQATPITTSTTTNTVQQTLPSSQPVRLPV
ncbi:uncharacterized protein LOC129906287 isoform X2 [Episyrphus balteatus]|uniref:uncharacterized protein LOC129906287 isoform X2 n=1 Tax=Episyrphus balteatus TaxID=286459 RepID=UPI00248539F6|nr:uncharacterized protein LOC129906287 isoform X2 [Episyrphus balteatus]